MRASPLGPGSGGVRPGRPLPPPRPRPAPSPQVPQAASPGELSPLRRDLSDLARTLSALTDAVEGLRATADRLAERQAAMIADREETDGVRRRVRRLAKRVKRLERRADWQG